jgi:hypothetical protein
VDSPKPQLAWSEWNEAIDGLEWLNADSEWRSESRLGLMRALAGYLLRPAAALARMLDRPAKTLARWDALSETRRIITLAGHDAHGGALSREEGRPPLVAGIPSYESSFRSFSTGVVLDAPLTQNAAQDAKALLTAVRAGHTFTTIDGFGTRGLIDFHLRTNTGFRTMGGSDYPGTAARVVAHVAMPPGAQMVVVRNGHDIATSSSGTYEGDVTGEQGSLRIEVRRAGAAATEVPWLLSNPIFHVHGPAPAPSYATLWETGAHLAWHVEKDAGSTATLETTERGAGLSFRLYPVARQSQFVALAADLPAGVGAFDWIGFVTDSDRPARVSVQLRYPGGLRWARSAVMNAGAHGNGVFVEDMVPADHQTSPQPDTRQARWLLFVIDLTNMAPGGTGTFSIRDVTLARTSRAGR